MNGRPYKMCSRAIKKSTTTTFSQSPLQSVLIIKLINNLLIKLSLFPKMLLKTNFYFLSIRIDIAHDKSSVVKI